MRRLKKRARCSIMKKTAHGGFVFFLFFFFTSKLASIHTALYNLMKQMREKQSRGGQTRVENGFYWALDFLKCLSFLLFQGLSTELYRQSWVKLHARFKHVMDGFCRVLWDEGLFWSPADFAFYVGFFFLFVFFFSCLFYSRWNKIMKLDLMPTLLCVTCKYRVGHAGDWCMDVYICNLHMYC